MKKLTLLLSSFFFLVAACSPTATATPQSTEPQTITILTHDSFAVSEKVVKSFEDANNAKVSFLQSGDAGAVLNKAVLTKDAPLADVLFGVDNTFLSRALEADIFEPYQSPALSRIPTETTSRGPVPAEYHPRFQVSHPDLPHKQWLRIAHIVSKQPRRRAAPCWHQALS